MRPRFSLPVVIRLGAIVICAWLAPIQSSHGAAISTAAFDEDLSAYKRTPASGAIAEFHERLDRNETQLTNDRDHGYLLSLLRALNISTASQLLVASKTSPNRALISPHNPRALYYNSSVSVAYVPSAPVIEVAAADPKLGIVFYTLEQKEMAKPRLMRDNRCLECHASAKTLNVPGPLVRSFLTKDDGEVDVLSGLMVNHRTPIAERWGGYYVTGTHGAQTHRGNLFGQDAILRHERNPSENGNVIDLKPFLNTAKYPQPGSDIVALLVFDHQVHMHNLLTRLRYEADETEHTGDSLRAAYPATEAVLKYMLFLDEPRLSAPVHGNSEFSEWFEAQGLKDKRGRSLFQFDLRTRLFKFPCSYMVYSPSFEALPLRARRHLYFRLGQILGGEDKSPEFTALPEEARNAIREILIDTKPDVPVSWRL